MLKVQSYLIANHPDRSPDQFILHAVADGVQALMIFFEMVTKDELLWRVQFVRSEIDEEIENSFWSASDQDNLRVSLLPYSTQLYSSVTGVDNDNRLVYKPQLTQCKPVKYFKIQLFAIAKKCPQLDVGFSGHNRTIKFKGHQIWPW